MVTSKKRQQYIVSVRLTATELAWLDELCARTERDRSKVLRLLLRQAKPTGAPDVVLLDRDYDPAIGY